MAEEVLYRLQVRVDRRCILAKFVVFFNHNLPHIIFVQFPTAIPIHFKCIMFRRQLMRVCGVSSSRASWLSLTCELLSPFRLRRMNKTMIKTCRISPKDATAIPNFASIDSDEFVVTLVLEGNIWDIEVLCCAGAHRADYRGYICYSRRWP